MLHNGRIEDITSVVFFKALNQAECAYVQISKRDIATLQIALPLCH
jgi:hypothetical protein